MSDIGFYGLEAAIAFAFLSAFSVGMLLITAAWYWKMSWRQRNAATARNKLPAYLFAANGIALVIAIILVIVDRRGQRPDDAGQVGRHLPPIRLRNNCRASKQ